MMQPVHVCLPHNLTTANMHSVIGKILDTNGWPLAASVNIDFSRLSFIHPDGITIICNLIEWLLLHSVRVYFVGIDQITRCLAYLDDCGLFSTYLQKPLRPHARPRNTTLPFKKIRHADSHSWLDHEAFPWIAQKMQMDPSAISEFRACVREVFNNVQDHSTQDIACVHTQWFPNIERLRIAIADFGVGIPHSMKSLANGRDDAAVIEMATYEGVTSKRGRNHGAGLSYLLDNVVGRNQGRVEIFSHRGQLHCAPGPGEQKIVRRSSLAAGFYPGTLLAIELRTDTIEIHHGGTEDLQW